MMKILSALLVGGILIFSTPSLTSAQTPPPQSNNPIATEESRPADDTSSAIEIDEERGVVTSGGFVPCDGPDCSSCHVVVLANTLIQWLITMVFLFFAVLAIWAGIQLVVAGGNPGARQQAKDKFTNAFIGLLIVLAAWLMVDTLMRGLVRQSGGEGSGIGPWNQV